LTGLGLSERLGQPFIIENRTGAGSNIATEQSTNSTPRRMRCWQTPNSKHGSPISAARCSAVRPLTSGR
jgi:tripartite-type tricarboxylate transporter receptor subunit TctC